MWSDPQKPSGPFLADFSELDPWFFLRDDLLNVGRRYPLFCAQNVTRSFLRTKKARVYFQGVQLLNLDSTHNGGPKSAGEG